MSETIDQYRQRAMAEFSELCRDVPVARGEYSLIGDFADQIGSRLSLALSADVSVSDRACLLVTVLANLMLLERERSARHIEDHADHMEAIGNTEAEEQAVKKQRAHLRAIACQVRAGEGWIPTYNAIAPWMLRPAAETATESAE